MLNKINKSNNIINQFLKVGVHMTREKNTKLPLNEIIQQDIINAIATDKLRSNNKLPTEAELMSQYKVSRVTVSKALTALVNHNLLVRYPKRGTFVSSDAKAALKLLLTPDADQGNIQSLRNKQRPLHVSLIIPTMADQFALNIVKGIKEALNFPAFCFNIAISDGEQATEAYWVDMLQKNGTDGIILFPVDQKIYNDHILKMKLERYPLVLIDRCLPGIDANYIISDNIKGGRLATAHLCDLGHKNIALCYGNDVNTFTTRDRIEGYKKELVSRHMFYKKSNILSVSEQDLLPGAPLHLQLLNGESDAFIALESKVAILLYNFFKREGLLIPKDKSIVSFDSPAINCADINTFTYVEQSEYLMGLEAGKVMKNLLNPKHKAHRPVRQIIEPKLMMGNSTMAVAAHC